VRGEQRKVGGGVRCVGVNERRGGKKNEQGGSNRMFGEVKGGRRIGGG